MKTRHASAGLAAALAGVAFAIATTRPSGAQEPPASPTPAAHPQQEFVGSKHCKKCHLEEFRSWEQTPMAKAYEILAPGQRAEAKQAAGLDPTVDYRQDPNCVPCHVVGFGQPGGFSLEHAGEEDKHMLQGVGCEMCHGAARGYLGRGFKDRGYADEHDARLPQLIERFGYQPHPNAETCARCHNEKSPTFKPFDFEQRKAQGIHAHPQPH